MDPRTILSPRSYFLNHYDYKLLMYLPFFRFLVNHSLVQQPSFSSISVLLNWVVIYSTSRDHTKSLISLLMVVINLLGICISIFQCICLIFSNTLFQCNSVISSRLPGRDWDYLDSDICIRIPLECILPGSSLYVSHVSQVLVSWTFLSQLRSLRSVVLPDASSVPPTHATATISPAQRRCCIIFLFLEAVTQILYMAWGVRRQWSKLRSVSKRISKTCSGVALLIVAWDGCWQYYSTLGTIKRDLMEINAQNRWIQALDKHFTKNSTWTHSKIV